jgi:zinc protease
MPITGIEKTVKEFTAEALLKFYEAWRDGGSWVFAVAGGAPAELVESIFSKKFSSFKNQRKNRDLIKVLSGEPSMLGIPARPRRTQEQAHLSIAGLGPKWGDNGREAVDILVNILGGHGGRLFTTLRDQESLAYTVSPLHSNGVWGGIVGAYIATAVDKASRAMSGLERELRKISSSGPTMDEIHRAKSYILGSHEIGLQRTSSQAMTMALMELYGMGWDDFLHYPERIRHVSVEEIKDAAQQYFDPSRMESVIVGAE